MFFKYGSVGLYNSWNNVHNVGLKISFWNSLLWWQQQGSFLIYCGLALISPSLAGPWAESPWAGDPGTGGPVAGGLVQDMEALKQKFQKLEFQEPELWGKGIEGIIVGHLGALGGWRRWWWSWHPLRWGREKTIKFTPRSQWTHSLHSLQSLVQLPSWNARVTSLKMRFNFMA